MATEIGENDAPLLLEESGKPPATRIQSAQITANRIARIMDADRLGRSKRRGMVKGLVDGNPPYKAARLRRAGRADTCNVNWRVAEAYLTQAIGLFYDVFSEASTFAEVMLELDDTGMEQDKSSIVTEEFDRLQKEDRSWDYGMQSSQYEMVLYGCGPLVFENEYDWRPRSVHAGDLYVPDYTRSNITEWDEAAVSVTWQPHELFEYIVNPSMARAMGWNVSAVRKAIMRAHPRSRDSTVAETWEWHQTQLKTNSFHYSAESNVIRCSHYFVREFDRDGEPGKISHAIIQLPNAATDNEQEYLFFAENRYENWEQVIHPMYYDTMGGGYHHSVTGMGVKMFSALEFQNRLLCNLADKAFAPSMIFRPTSASGAEEFALVSMGEHAVTSPGFEMNQSPVRGFIEEGLAFSREVSLQLASNLSSYRQNLTEKGGNPLTATEVNQRAAEQARLGKTQLARYYNQLDWLYKEKYRRATETKGAGYPGGKAAMDFIKRCKKRGVDLREMKKVRIVQANRVVGQGSELLRQMSLDYLLKTVGGMLPESGRDGLVRDVIAARAGQAKVRLYNPAPRMDSTMQDQQAIASLQVAGMRAGVAPVYSEHQDHQLFAVTFVKAIRDALAATQQGADPGEVFKFTELAGPAIAQHIQAMYVNPALVEAAKVLEREWTKIAAAVDQLQRMAEQQQMQAARARQRAQAMLSDEQMKAAAFKSEEQRKQTGFDLEQQRESARLTQEMALADIQSAQAIRTRTNGS